MYRLLVAMAAMAMLALASCGNVAESATSGTSDISAPSETPDVERFCTTSQQLSTQVESGAIDPLSEQGSEEYLQLLQTLHDAAPVELRADIQEVIDGAEDMAGRLSDAGWDIAKVDLSDIQAQQGADAPATRLDSAVTQLCGAE